MQRPPPIPILNRNSMEYRSGGNLLNSITPCKEYYTHDSYGKSKYCIEVDLQGYPEESIRITRQSQDVTISLNHEEIKPTGEKYKQEFRREIQLPQSVDLNTLKSTILNKNTLLLCADVNRREQPILRSSQMSPNSKRHINWGISCSPTYRNSLTDSPRLRTSFSSETRHRNSSFTNLPNNFNKSFHMKKTNPSNYSNTHRLSNRYSRSNSFTKTEPIHIPVRVETNQIHHQSNPANNVQNIRVEVGKNQSTYLKQSSKPSTLNHHQSQSPFLQNTHPNHNNHNYYYQNEHKMLNNSTLKSQRPLHILPVTNSFDENDSINNISIQNHYNNPINRLINHTTSTATTTTSNTTTTTNNNSNHLTKPTKFYTQSMKVGLDVKPEDLNIHLKNGLLTIMIKQKGNNIENNQKTKIAREFLHENTIPINVDQNKLIAKLDNGILIWEAPYMTTTSTISSITGDLIDIPG
uniref:SHSP domain-containing protein n=1 Tax=Schistosoma mansoni TaxID=6183 RepID=A0A3Q0KMT1_SCHMA